MAWAPHQHGTAKRIFDVSQTLPGLIAWGMSYRPRIFSMLAALKISMHRIEHRFGTRVAQALFALLLTLIVTQGAFAATACDCPDCPTQGCMQIGCAGRDDGAGCTDMIDAACHSLYVSTAFAPSLGSIGSATSNAAVIRGTYLSANVSDESARPRPPPVAQFAAPPVHIFFCRLLR